MSCKLRPRGAPHDWPGAPQRGSTPGPSTAPRQSPHMGMLEERGGSPSAPGWTGSTSPAKPEPTRERFGWEGTLQTTQFHPPAMGRDPSHQPRVLRAPSNLALSPAREGAATASLGSLGQGLSTLTGKRREAEEGAASCWLELSR